MRLLSIVRWLLVVPSAVVAWYFAFVLSVYVFAVVVGPCLSSDGPQPGRCEMTWLPVEFMRHLVVLSGIGLSAILVVAVSALVAPSHRAGVAWSALSVGAVVAGVMGYRLGAFSEAAVAVAAGVLAAVLISRFASGSGNARIARTNVAPNA